MADAGRHLPRDYKNRLKGAVLPDFGNREHLNREKWLGLQINKSFLADIGLLRKSFKIPKTLRIESDMRADFVPYGDTSVEVAESMWVESLEKAERRDFDSALDSILTRYGLPLNFRDFLLLWVLYRDIPSGNPLYNWELSFQIIDNPNEAKRIPLNKQEKRTVLRDFRRILGIKSGRIPKQYTHVYSRLQQALAESKNTQRRSRSMESAFAVMRLKKDNKNYLDVVAELYPDDEISNTSPEMDRKKASRLRQQISRFIRRSKRK